MSFSEAAEAQNKYKVLQIHSVALQSNEVNQGDALEHNFSAIHAALMFPLTHLLGAALPQVCLLHYGFLITVPFDLAFLIALNKQKIKH